MPTFFEAEIQEQPESLRRLLVSARPAVDAAAAAIARFGPRFVVTAARGSSDNAARYAKYLFGVRNRLVVGLGAPSLVTVYGSPPDMRQALVVGLSQSGQSPDIVALVVEARRQGALTVALTNHVDSPLGRACEHVIDLGVGLERAVVASKTYTAQLLGLGMLSAAVEEAMPRSGDPAPGAEGGAGGAWKDLAAIPDAVARALELRPQVDQAIASWPSPQRLLVLGRGFNFSTAFEIALKLKETAYLGAEAYATPDFFHGPLAVVEAGYPVLLLAPSGVAGPDMDGLLDALNQHQAAVVAISDDAAVCAHPAVRVGLELPAGVPEWLSPITAVIPGQLMALALAQARNINPDSPRALTKITRTM